METEKELEMETGKGRQRVTCGQVTAIEARAESASW